MSVLFYVTYQLSYDSIIIWVLIEKFVESNFLKLAKKKRQLKFINLLFYGEKI